MAYKVSGLAREDFAELFAMGDAELAERNACRVRATGDGFPCRVSLKDAEAGDMLIEQGRQIAAHVLEASAADLEFARGRYTIAGTDRGIALVVNGDEALLATRPEMSDLIQSVKKQELSDPLSKSALETLAIILYKNGATKPEIDFIRGVNSGFMLRNLMVRGLIEKVAGGENRRVGRYRATFDTLRHLGVTGVSELPNFETFALELAKREEQDSEPEQNVFTQ